MDSYLVRLQLRLGARLATDSTCLTATVEGREVSIKAPFGTGPISQSEQVVLEACGFSSMRKAKEFGERLRSVSTIAGLCAHLGVDATQDNALTCFDERQLRGLGFITPVHVEVIHKPTGLLSAIEELAAPGTPEGLSREMPNPLATALQLLNLAMITRDRRAKIVMAISAIEGLFPQEKWTKEQNKWLRQWKTDTADRLDKTSAKEMQEIANRVRDLQMDRTTVRQGVFRILDQNGLGHLRSEWDAVYGLRSKLFHGGATFSRKELSSLAWEAVSLSATIILAMIDRRGIKLPSVARIHFLKLPE